MRVVLDTNVIFQGLTQQGGAAGLIIDACFVGLIQACVSNTLSYEYVDVLSRKLSETRWLEIQPVLGLLLRQAEYIPIYYSWRPTSPDAGDDFVIDCGMNAGATIVTENIRDFLQARESLGLQVLTPVELIVQLTRSQERLS
ncbi:MULTISPECIES: putative toxin-antitoxin system toxin component, PIN family [Spirulina sp. CCY15215]|uniref:putative toxin-antitoxin system toxin component, PIN family n=1 Tax=Spirulina sp. CCY15215 TaxID=2767591 RepID=UPI0019517AB9|nr:putative toxin-antitoxin system toxin component, PIN family [Spirulina major]